MAKIHVYLDDERETPPGFDKRVYTEQEAIDLIKEDNVEFISLDFNLSMGCGNGLNVAKFIEISYLKGEIEFIDFHPHTDSTLAWGWIMEVKRRMYDIRKSKLNV